MRTSLDEKKYIHIFYLCECMYGLVVDTRRTISKNPGCEWEL